MNLHHVGIVCDESFIERFETTLNMVRTSEKRVPEFECVCYMYNQVELVVPYGGPLLKRLNDMGAHIHHFALLTHDVQSTSRAYRESGHNVVLNEPVHGVNNTLVNFLHPLELGVMVEFVECLR